MILTKILSIILFGVGTLLCTVLSWCARNKYF